MEINDYVYGKVQIFEPVIIELIQSPSMQRLKGIDQGGYRAPFFTTPLFNRFAHSVGVYSILQKYGAPLEEQIAGLLHDVSHSAFSHTIDYVFPEGSQKELSHQDNIFADFVRKSELPQILKRHHVKVEYIVRDVNFPLKENKLPDICADRIDYTLREGRHDGIISKKDARYFLDHLTVIEKKWVFKDFESAKRFSEKCFELNKTFWSGISTALMFKTTGDYLQYALGKNYLTRDDLYSTDQRVLDLISIHLNKDKKLKLLFDRMNNRISYKNDPKDFESHVYIKSRCIDPLCEHNGVIKRVSEIDPQWAKVVEEEMRPKEYFLKFEK